MKSLTGKLFDKENFCIRLKQFRKGMFFSGSILTFFKDSFQGREKCIKEVLALKGTLRNERAEEENILSSFSLGK